MSTLLDLLKLEKAFVVEVEHRPFKPLAKVYSWLGFLTFWGGAFALGAYSAMHL